MCVMFFFSFSAQCSTTSSKLCVHVLRLIRRNFSSLARKAFSFLLLLGSSFECAGLCLLDGEAICSVDEMEIGVFGKVFHLLPGRNATRE